MIVTHVKELDNIQDNVFIILINSIKLSQDIWYKMTSLWYGNFLSWCGYIQISKNHWKVWNYLFFILKPEEVMIQSYHERNNLTKENDEFVNDIFTETSLLSPIDDDKMINMIMMTIIPLKMK